MALLKYPARPLWFLDIKRTHTFHAQRYEIVSFWTVFLLFT